MEPFCSDVESHLSAIKMVMLPAAQTSRLFWRLGTRWGSLFYPSGGLNRKKWYIKYKRSGVFVIIFTQKNINQDLKMMVLGRVMLYFYSWVQGLYRPYFGERLCLLGETAWLTGWIQSVRGGTAVKCLKLRAGSCWTNSIIPNIKQSLQSKRSQRGEIHFLIPCQKLSLQKKRKGNWFSPGFVLVGS